MEQTQFDVIIVGGGMVGATQALALANQNKRILVLEKQLPQQKWLESAPLRVSAINRFSEQLLTDLGIWSNIAEHSACVFNRLATWELPQHAVEFNADDIQESHLGFLIRNEAIQLAAYKECEQHPNVCYLQCDQVITLVNGEYQAQLSYSTSDEVFQVSADLVIAADGAMSLVRKLAGIGTSGWDYQQQCFSITIKTDFPQQDVTWQEFQPSGPKAFLPLADGYACLIWYDSAETITALKSSSNDQLKQRVLEVFPPLAGDFEIVQHASFPLTRRQANQYYHDRVVLVGDAAHTINPLAGQGVNLGYKDVAKLTELLAEVDIADITQLCRILNNYQRSQKAQALVMSGAMDSFYKLFSNEAASLKQIRNGLLQLTNKVGWAKKQVLKKAIGF